MSPALLSLALLCQSSSPWSVNANNALIWESKPYLPVGVRIEGTPEEIEKAAAAGIRDFLIELPADGTGWDKAFAALESHQARYTILVSSAAPSTMCYLVEPQAYRREGLQSKFTLDIPLRGATNLLAVLAAKRDGGIRWTEKIAVTDGTARINADATGTEQVLLLYPQMPTMDVPDFWDGFDRHRDNLLRALKQSKPGPGLRGIVNPFGSVVDFPDRANGAIPTSPLFQLELESRLTERYRTVGNVTKAWGMGTNDVENMRHASRLIPLWFGQRGVGGIWDPKTDKVYTADLNRSEIWNDIREAIAGSMDRRMNRLVQAIRQAADVPVTQEWAGWDGPYTSKDQMIAGMGGRINPATFETLGESASMPASTVLRRGAGTLMATAIPLPGPESQRLSLQDVIRETEDMGYRGWFFQPGKADDLAEIASIANARAADSGAANLQPKALFYPLGARNPASPSRVPGSTMWWLPNPGDGDRIDFGPSIMGYRVSGGRDPLVALWTRSGSRRVRLRATNPKALQFRTVDGSDPDVRVAKKHVEVTLTPSPLLIIAPNELPVPEESFIEVAALLKKLIETYELRVDAGGAEVFQMRENIRIFEDSPGPAYLTLIAQLHRIVGKAAPFAWVEAEGIRMHSFSDVVSLQGASEGRAMRLDARLPSPPKGYSLDFNYQTPAPKPVRVWIAGRISDQQAKGIRMMAGDQVSDEPSPATNHYGDGFAWRYLGEVALAGGSNAMRLVADIEGAIDIDVIVLGDEKFQPEGGSPPRSWANALPAPQPRTGSGGS